MACCQATSDDDCNSVSEHSEPYHNQPNTLYDIGGHQAGRDDGTMDTRISDTLPSRPGSRLSNTSPDESSDEVRWLDRHFELVGPALPSLTCMPHSYSHPLDSAESNSSDPLHFPDVRVVSLPAQSLLSHSPSSPSLSLTVHSHPQELERILYSYGESMPGTPASSYTIDLERDATSLFHIPTSPVARPSSPLRFAPRPAVSSTNGLTTPEHDAFPASVAIAPHDNQQQTSEESPQREVNIAGLPDVSIAIEFATEDAQTRRPTFTSRITTSESSQHSVSVRTDARVALNDASARPLTRDDTSGAIITLSRNAARRASRSRAMSLSQKLGSFVARRLSMNRARRHSASAGSSAPPHPAHWNAIVSGSSVSYEATNPRPSADQTNLTSPPSDAFSGERRRRYTLVLEIDVDVPESGLTVASAPRSLVVPRSPSSRTSFQAPHSHSPNSRTSFDADLASASHRSSSPYSPRVSFSPMPSSPLASQLPPSVAEMDTLQPSHEQKLSHRSDTLRILSSAPSRPASRFDNSASEPTMTVTIERDDASPLARLMRRISIGRGRRRSATTSFVLASTRVLPVPEYTAEHAHFDDLPAPDMNEPDSAPPDVAALTPTSEQMRRWSAPAGPTVPRHLNALAGH